MGFSRRKSYRFRQRAGMILLEGGEEGVPDAESVPEL